MFKGYFSAHYGALKLRNFFLALVIKVTYFLRNLMSKSATTTKQKRGRPRMKITKARASLSLHPELLTEARKVAYRSGQSLSMFIDHAIRTHLEKPEA